MAETDLGIHLAVLALRRRGEVDQCVPNFSAADPVAAIDRCVSRLPENTQYLKALACKRITATAQAMTLLEQALKLGQPGGWVRPFVASGREMRSLFDRLNRKTISQAYVDTLITAIDNEMPAQAVRARAGRTSSRPANSAGVVPSAPLTHREVDIIELLRGRLSNQEIADTLCISPETVKRHLYNIYKKLSVKNRREAAAKTAALKRPT